MGEPSPSGVGFAHVTARKQRIKFSTFKSLNFATHISGSSSPAARSALCNAVRAANKNLGVFL
jgi:hypothetical protein